MDNIYELYSRKNELEEEIRDRQERLSEINADIRSHHYNNEMLKRGDKPFGKCWLADGDYDVSIDVSRYWKYDNSKMRKFIDALYEKGIDPSQGYVKASYEVPSHIYKGLPNELRELVDDARTATYSKFPKINVTKRKV